MGDDTAASRFRLLRSEFTQPPRNAPDGQPSARPAHPSAPLHLGIIDHMAAAVAEVTDQVRRTVPEAGPRPVDDADVYAWWREGTAHLGPEIEQARETVIYRQALEHALAMGDPDVVRPHPCPGCGCWSLYWDRRRKMVWCAYAHCTTESGTGSTWSLAQIAHQHVARQKKLKRNAT